MPSPLAETAADAASFVNVKTFGDAPSFWLSQTMANAVSHAQRLNQIAEAATASAVKALLEVDPLEAISTVKALTGNDLAQVLSSLLAALQSGQIGTKTAQTTPPPTA